MTNLEASIIVRVFSGIQRVADRERTLGDSEDALAMYRLLGALSVHLFPYTSCSEDNPLATPRCKECGHTRDDHNAVENGRCNHYTLPHGYNVDTMCACSGYVDDYVSPLISEQEAA